MSGLTTSILNELLDALYARLVTLMAATRVFHIVAPAGTSTPYAVVAAFTEGPDAQALDRDGTDPTLTVSVNFWDADAENTFAAHKALVESLTATALVIAGYTVARTAMELSVPLPPDPLDGLHGLGSRYRFTVLAN